MRLDRVAPRPAAPSRPSRYGGRLLQELAVQVLPALLPVAQQGSGQVPARRQGVAGGRPEACRPRPARRPGCGPLPSPPSAAVSQRQQHGVGDVAERAGRQLPLQPGGAERRDGPDRLAGRGRVAERRLRGPPPAATARPSATRPGRSRGSAGVWPSVPATVDLEQPAPVGAQLGRARPRGGRSAISPCTDASSTPGATSMTCPNATVGRRRPAGPLAQEHEDGGGGQGGGRGQPAQPARAAWPSAAPRPGPGAPARKPPKMAATVPGPSTE